MTGTDIPGAIVGVSPRRGPEWRDRILVTDNRWPDSKEGGDNPEPVSIPVAGSGREAEEKEDY